MFSFILLTHPVLDVSSFGRSLSGKPDAGFFVFGELASFIRKLAVRCLLSSSVPAELEWTQLVKLKLGVVKRISSRQFLRRLNLESKAAAAASMKASNDSSDRGGTKDSVKKLSDKLLDDFALLARDYFVFLLKEVLGHISLTSDGVKGLASFDPKVLLVLPTNMSFSFFTTLYKGFSSRGWVKEVDQQLYLEEYMSFVYDLRRSYPTLVESPDLIFDVVSYLSTSVKLRSRPLLLYIFRLSCLCLTDAVSEFPSVQFGTVDSSKLGCTMNEVFYPVQSYLSCVPNCIEACCRGESVTRFLNLCSTFGNRAFSSTYTPWSDVDYCGQASFSSILQESYGQLNGGKESDERPKKDRILHQSKAGPRSIPIPKRVVGRVTYGPISQADVAIVASKLVQGGSKD